jgi:hypothetical protein
VSSSSSGRAWALLRRLTLEELAAKSQLIVTGEVLDLRSYRAPFHGRGDVIFTDVTIRIGSVLKGEPRSDRIEVQVLGGTMGATTHSCPDSPRYTRGEKVLVFLREYNLKLWNTGWLQGKYRLAEASSVKPSSLKPSTVKPDTVVRGDRRLPISRDTSLAELKVRIETSPSLPSGTVLHQKTGPQHKSGFVPRTKPALQVSDRELSEMRVSKTSLNSLNATQSEELREGGAR